MEDGSHCRDKIPVLGKLMQKGYVYPHAWRFALNEKQESNE